MSGMIEVKTSELEGAALDWAVAQADGFPVQYSKRLGVHVQKTMQVSADPSYIRMGSRYQPSTDWSQGGPLIDKYQIEFRYVSDEIVRAVLATGAAFIPTPFGTGQTHLIAACRAIVAAKLGETVSVPAELLNHA